MTPWRATLRRDRRAILFDGNSILHGAYHGTPPLFNARGDPVHAVFTALRSVVSWLGSGNNDGRRRRSSRVEEEEEAHDHPWSNYDLAAVCWDRREPTYRNTIIPGYKAQRPPSPDDLKSQFGMTRDAIARLGVCQFDAVGFEADDLIATLATTLSASGTPVTIVSSDKDLLQLVREGAGDAGDNEGYDVQKVYGNVDLAHPFKRTRRGVTEVERVYGVKPEQLPGLFALVGDAADNVKGVKGVGVKLGGRLMQEYGNVQEVARVACGLVEGVSGMTRKEKIALGFDAKVLRGLILVKAHLAQCGSTHGGGESDGALVDGREEEWAKYGGPFVPLEDLESVHRMVTDAPLRRMFAQEAKVEANGEFDMVYTDSPDGGEEADESEGIEWALAVPRTPPPAFGEMLSAHGFHSIFKMFPQGMIEPPSQQPGQLEEGGEKEEGGANIRGHKEEDKEDEEVLEAGLGYSTVDPEEDEDEVWLR